MVPFFYLAVLIYGSCSSSLEPIMEDLAKEDSKVHLNQTSVATSNNFMADLLANPKEFVAQVAQLDPVELKKIITLLSALKGTSEAREAHLLDVWNDKIAEAVITGNAVVAAQTAVNDAQTVVTNAEGAVVDAQTAVTDAQAVVTNAKAVKVVKQQELASADTAHTTKLGERDAAKKTHDDEIVQLNDEQQVLSDVIVMLEQLHPKQASLQDGVTVGNEFLTGKQCASYPCYAELLKNGKPGWCMASGGSNADPRHSSNIFFVEVWSGGKSAQECQQACDDYPNLCIGFYTAPNQRCNLMPVSTAAHNSLQSSLGWSTAGGGPTHTWCYDVNGCEIKNVWADPLHHCVKRISR